MVTNMKGVVEDSWFEVLEKGVVIRTVIEFPRSIYYLGHPKKRFRVNTLYRYQDRSIMSSVDEFCSDERPYETASSFFPRPKTHDSAAFNRHKKRVNQLIAKYQDQIGGDCPLKNKNYYYIINKFYYFIPSSNIYKSTSD
jgi:hypothetical protein